jgi:hypothetical protein
LHTKYEFQRRGKYKGKKIFLYAVSFISCNLLYPLSHKYHCFYRSGTIYQSSINIDARDGNYNKCPYTAFLELKNMVPTDQKCLFGKSGTNNVWKPLLRYLVLHSRLQWTSKSLWICYQWDINFKPSNEEIQWFFWKYFSFTFMLHTVCTLYYLYFRLCKEYKTWEYVFLYVSRLAV